ncbi:MAG: hypothetical protein CMP49_04185 [Flavobacteriales bacterium]|nr:hypothetical protein [Flavobacteriales bacterium]|tara:strand:+ start:122 stop:772 length:651 start_codon:yes stop_codon:yes gene_type:complete
MLKNKFFFLVFLTFSTIMVSQNFGVRMGLATATITGNNDSYDFDFINSFSPGFQASILGRYVLSDVIIFKPELVYRYYTVTQKEDFDLFSNLEFDQIYSVVSADINFDIELTDKFSFIFGMGLDFMLNKKNIIYFSEKPEENIVNLNINPIDSRFDPFTNIGLCYKVNKNLLLDLQYRHLLDNWGTSNEDLPSQIASPSNGSVKIHMINVAIAILL